MSTGTRARHILTTVLLCAAALHAAPAGAADYEGFPFVNDDGTLSIHQDTIHLYGIMIPSTDESCMLFQRPVSCAPRAVLALKFDLDSSYVKCTHKDTLHNGVVVAKCMADHTDIAAELLQQGWAAALPDAPAQYGLLEDIARQHGLGIWGFPLGSFPRPYSGHRP